MERSEFQKKLIGLALAEGFSDCEAYYRENRHFEVMVLEGEISDYENSGLRGVAFRGTFAGRTGYAYTERMEEEDISYLVRSAKENAVLLPESERERLYAPEEAGGCWEKIHPHLEQLTAEEKVQAAKRMEAAALQGADQVVSMDYCVLGTDWTETAIQNSLGLDVCCRRNMVTAYVCAIAKAGDEVKTGAHFWKGQDWHSFDPAATGKQAAQMAASHLGAGGMASGRYGVVLEGRVMASFLRVFAPVFYGETVQKGFSLLEGKKDEKIAADCVSLRDDPLLETGYVYAPFDSEGVPCRNKAVVEKGVLKTFLYNMKSAEKDGVASTGNGFKAGLTSPVKTAVTNFYLEPGKRSREELLAELGEGLIITDITGLHAGANTVSGDFSLSAEGFLVEKGKQSRPVEQITVAGNFYELLENILEVGSDLYFAGNGTGSPSVRVREMSVAGE